MAEVKVPTLRELVGAPVEISIGDRKLAIAPMGWYQASIAMESLLPALQAMPIIGAELGEAREDRAALWAGVIVTYRDEIAEFCAAATGLPIDEIKALPPTYAIELVMGVVEVNADFFGRSLPGLLTGARGRLARLMERWAPLLEAAGATASSMPSSG